MRKTGGLCVGLVALVAGCGVDPDACDSKTPGTVCTVAGIGDPGFSGDGASARAARLYLPMDVVAAADGSLFVVDWNNQRIREIGTDGRISTVAGDGELETMNHPTQIVMDPTGTKLVIAAWHSSKVLAFDLATRAFSTIAGDGTRSYRGDGGPAIAAGFDLPASLAWAPNGDLMVLDQENQVLRAIDGAGNVRHVAGSCVIDTLAACAPGQVPAACPGSDRVTCGDPATTCTYTCDGGYGGDAAPASALRMAQPFGEAAVPGGRIVFDPAGNLYFADTNNDVVRMIDTNGIVHRVAGQPPVDGARHAGYSGDGGAALAAQLNGPVDLARGDDGTLYVTDVNNHCIRAIAPDGVISTAAGVCGTPGFADGAAASALFHEPYGVEWVPGALYIADTENNVIRALYLK